MRQLFLIACVLWQISIFAQTNAESYPVDSASIEQPGTPKGEVLKFTFDQSKITRVHGGSFGFMFLLNIKETNLPVSTSTRMEFNGKLRLSLII
jgi:hypothetical protein